MFKRFGCKNFELLGQVLGKSIASGHLYHASTQPPPNSNEEWDNEEEFLNRSVHANKGDKSSFGSSKEKCIADDWNNQNLTRWTHA